jgi:D-3-phosphoglycerate dehydrogenase
LEFLLNTLTWQWRILQGIHRMYNHLLFFVRKALRFLISNNRIIIMCASHINGDAPILGKPEIDLMFDHYLINTARGELVDEDALLEAIDSERLAGVATDVLSYETGANHLARWNAASNKHNVILTPHIGGATFTAMSRTENFIVKKLSQTLVGKEIIT